MNPVLPGDFPACCLRGQASRNRHDPVLTKEHENITLPFSPSPLPVPLARQTGQGRGILNVVFSVGLLTNMVEFIEVFMFSFEKKAVKRITEKLKKLLGDNLLTILVFGSRVRGDFSAESDFDILVVVKKRTFGVIDAVNEVLSEEESKTGIPFSVVVKGMESFERERQYNTSFYRNIKREGIVLHGSAQR